MTAENLGPLSKHVVSYMHFPPSFKELRINLSDSVLEMWNTRYTVPKTRIIYQLYTFKCLLCFAVVCLRIKPGSATRVQFRGPPFANRCSKYSAYNKDRNPAFGRRRRSDKITTSVDLGGGWVGGGTGRWESKYQLQDQKSFSAFIFSPRQPLHFEQ